MEWRTYLESRKRVVRATEDALRRHALKDLSLAETGEISKIRLHPADLATDAQEVAALGALSEKNIKILQDIDDAMDRLSRGDFGRCLSCGENIVEDRLKIVPEARYCASCEAEISIATSAQASRQLQTLGHLKVSDVMQEHPVTAREDESIDAVAQLLSEYNVRHLPIVDQDGNVQGIVSDRDLLKVVWKVSPGLALRRAENAWSHRRVSEIMSKTPETVDAETELVDAGLTLLENKFGALPVVEGGRLVGIITESDFVRLVCQTV